MSRDAMWYRLKHPGNKLTPLYVTSRPDDVVLAGVPVGDVARLCRRLGFPKYKTKAPPKPLAHFADDKKVLSCVDDGQIIWANVLFALVPETQLRSELDQHGVREEYRTTSVVTLDGIVVSACVLTLKDFVRFGNSRRRG